MDLLHKIVSPGLFYAAAGVNILAGATLIADPLQKKDLVKALARKFGGNTKQAEDDLVSLAGTEMQVRGKGVVLVGVGALLLCALGHARQFPGDKTFLNALVGTIALGDVALLGLYFAEKQKNADFPALESEKKLLPIGIAYAAAEAVAFGSYLASCTMRGKH